MRSACPWPIHNSRLAEQGAQFTGLEVAAAIGAVSSIASIGMGIIGAGQQADAQRQAGDIAYRNALQQQQALEAQAKQKEADAKAEQAASQRTAIEQKRKSTIAAGRATAVMAASGAGVDTRLLEGILGEGDYAKDVALYEGDDRASKLNYGASLDRWAGNTRVANGAYTRSSMYSRASGTETAGYVKAGLQGLSLAAKYGGDFGGNYDLGKDTLRTANDADLGGYGIGYNYADPRLT
ncbi:MAG: hypothetical protein KGS44_12740 [Alphaproteobacteria bacterium]|nr:hypothetical protein [Alphaproteobacteria bacterium]